VSHLECSLTQERLEAGVPHNVSSQRWPLLVRYDLVTEHDMMCACEELAAKEELFVAPEGGACIAALKKLRQSGFLGKADRILIYNTGSGYKYLEAWKQYLNEA
jgi:threonine synthase